MTVFCCRNFYVIVPRARDRLILCNRILFRFKQNFLNFQKQVVIWQNAYWLIGRSVRTPWPRAKHFPVRPYNSVNKYILRDHRAFTVLFSSKIVDFSNKSRMPLRGLNKIFPGKSENFSLFLSFILIRFYIHNLYCRYQRNRLYKLFTTGNLCAYDCHNMFGHAPTRQGTGSSSC